MARQERWYFTKAELENSPSRRCGIDSGKELSYRQQAANFIQDMGQKLKVAQLVINTAIVYMHRFYTFHSFTRFHRNAIAACSLFLAAKVEEQPRKLEHVIKVSQLCISRETVDTKSEQYQTLAAELVYHENLMLRTLGFDLSVQHPHTSVVKCCQLVRANKDMAQASYFMATNSLHLTTMCLQYRPSVVACICIYFVCKWANFELPRSVEGKDWWTYVDLNVTLETLEQLTAEFINVFQNCPSRLKKLLSSNQSNKISNSPLKPIEDKKVHSHHDSKNDLQKEKEESKQQHSPKDTSKSHHTNSRFANKNTVGKEQSKKDHASKIDSHNDQSMLKHPLKSSANNQSNSVQATTGTVCEPQSLKENQSAAKSEEKSAVALNSNNSNYYTPMEMKQNLSVISSNPLNNNNNNSCNSSTFNESLFDAHFFSGDSNDYGDFIHKKSEIPDELLKMEFSDNDDSNPSENNISLTSTLMMNDSNDSKSLSHTFAPSKADLAGPHSFDMKNNQAYKGFHLESKASNAPPPPPLPQPPSSSHPTQPSSLFNNMFPNPNPLSNHLRELFAKTTTTDSTEESISNSKPPPLPPSQPSTAFGPKKPELIKGTLIGSKLLPNSSSAVNSIINSLNDQKSTFPSASAKIQGESKHFENNSRPTSMVGQPNFSLLGSTDLDESSNQSRSSKHHKEKHKHKEKHRHKEKHKHKHKHKDKDKERNREKYNVEHSSFKVLLSPTTKDCNQPQQPIKLKISKQKQTDDGNPEPLKLKITLSKTSPSETAAPVPPLAAAAALADSKKRKRDTDKPKSGNSDLYFPNTKVSRKS